VLELDPDDALGARLMLASLDREPLPPRISQAQLARLYGKRFHNWDTAWIGYFGHRLVAEALEKLTPRSKKLDILDVGCGTGLVGDLVRPLANRLDGVDLSPAMLKKADEKGVYDKTYLGDLLPFMRQHPHTYNAITCAATLIHFGDLSEAFRAAAGALRDGGLFVLTLFANDGDDDRDIAVCRNRNLAKGGCYAHSASYVRRTAEATGFSVKFIETRLHEYEKMTLPINGLLVALRRQSR
jgi:predicted TPR repeat methyltransferase